MGQIESPAKDKYHHGTLRETLIREAFSVLETHGLEALSLRYLAERAGVSKTAPYRHFEDKRALLLVLAAGGFEKLADRLENLMRRVRSLNEAVDRVKDLMRGYVGFARESPELYKLMMSSFGFGLHSPECARQSSRSFGCLIRASAEAQSFGWKKDQDARSLVVSLWASAHGWSGLLLENIIPDDLGISRDEMLEQTIAVL